MNFLVLVQKNVFNYEVQFLTNELYFYKFNEMWRKAQNFREGIMHKMSNVQSYKYLNYIIIIMLTYKNKKMF